MADPRAQSIPQTASAGTVPRGAQALWREQNAAFRARVLSQLRQTRDDAAPRLA
jgi:hypothetical protein